MIYTTTYSCQDIFHFISFRVISRRQGLKKQTAYRLPISISRPSFPGMGIPIMKIRRVMRPSHLYNGNPYTGKTASLYRDRPQVPRVVNSYNLGLSTSWQVKHLILIIIIPLYFCGRHWQDNMAEYFFDQEILKFLRAGEWGDWPIPRKSI